VLHGRVGLRMIVVAASASPSLAFAGAWTLPAGQGQAIVTSMASFADRAFAPAAPVPRYSKIELQALVEYGLTDWFTAIAAPGLQHIDIGAPTTARRTGMGYSDFGGRFRVLHGGSWIVSGQATVRVPGTNDTGNPAAIGYTGMEIDLRGLVGATFALYDMPAFVDVQAAHRIRTGGPPDEFRLDATFGVRPWSRWLLLAQSFNVFSKGAGAPGFASYEYYRLQASAVYALTEAFSLQLGGFTTYAGRNALQENALIFGAWYRF
jgi:protein XagA